MAIQKIKANKTASLTDLREPRAIIESLADGEVAILDRNKVVAYIRAADQEPDSKQSFRYLTKEEFAAQLPDVLEKAKPVLEYLKDK